MRQRALSTWLTTLSVLLGVGLATAVLIMHRGGKELFGQTEFGYDILIGPPKGSPLQLVLNTVYQYGPSAGVLPYSVYEDLLRNRQTIRIAVPIAVGDTYKGHPIIATHPKLFGFDSEGAPLTPEATLEYKKGSRYEMAQGKAFHAEKFEAVIGADISSRTGLKLGDKFHPTHGESRAEGKEEDEDHHEEEWTVVGVLKKTGTAADRVIYIPLISFFAIGEHEEGMEKQAQARERLQPRPAGQPAPAPQPTPAPPPTPATGPATTAHDDHDEHDHAFHLREDGTIELHLPKEHWQLSAIIVRSRGEGVFTGQVLYHYKVIDPNAVAVNPAMEMSAFFDRFFAGGQLVLLLIAVLVSVVAAVGILVSIYNSITGRMKEIAILRALGATRIRILSLICLEAALIGLIGGVMGLVAGHLLAAGASKYVQRLVGEGFNWLNVSSGELLYLLAVVGLSVLAGLVPALKAYRTPVADNLVS